MYFLLTYCSCLDSKTNYNSVGWGFSSVWCRSDTLVQRCVAVVLNDYCVNLQFELQGLSDHLSDETLGDFLLIVMFNVTLKFLYTTKENPLKTYASPN
ncbi:uncharacterized protein LOC130641581 isoform X2 [Hydractinia symbiolongicarpus]|uniref:uncharacterized protein LOC130641581 isoform X2 n=1 Tax=Hydractinia symbiolongicarpus TaxID=13093 RepID=UPI00254E7036|nr:uncharacterized protein LOC130641581 isoform X2 [Hydractinia symbiolongicarpus]